MLRTRDEKTKCYSHEMNASCITMTAKERKGTEKHLSAKMLMRKTQSLNLAAKRNKETCSFIPCWIPLYWPMWPSLFMLGDAAHKGWIFDAAASVAQTSDWPVVAEPSELVLHRLRQHRAVYVRVLGGFGCKFRVEVNSIQGVRLQAS